MLKNWKVSNFKSIYSMEAPLEFAPLTIFCGTNSSGKSSVLQSILLLQQTHLQQLQKNSKYWLPTILLNGELTRLGKFSEIISAARKSDKNNDKIAIAFTINNYKTNFYDSFDINDEPSVSIESKIEFKLDHDTQERLPIVNYISITDLNCKESKIILNYQDEHRRMGNYVVVSDNVQFIDNINSYDDLSERDLGIPFFQGDFNSFLPRIKFKKENLNESYNKNISIIHDFFSKKLYYIGPLRADPKKNSDNISLFGDMGVGYQGQYTADFYFTNKDKGVINLNQEYLKNNNLDIKMFMEDLDKYGSAAFRKGFSLEEYISQWLEYIDVADDITVNEEGNLKVKQGEREMGLNNVGVGVSQVLPIIVQCFAAEPGSTIIIEQPELHLHPKMQSRLADFFLVMSLTGIQLIIETHSEYIIDKLRLRIVQAPLDKPINKKVALYFVEKHNGASEFKRIEINDFSVMSEWPEGFFEESMQIANDILSAARQKEKDSGLDKEENEND
ncbi:DUF3696 domain-containing protein [Treponema sp. TIM-1]|uniref:AAA family ATPase n=1 Tax=Treponema sp. TIM-1 TaxID=2898417 RepID=UPI0039810BF6